MTDANILDWAKRVPELLMDDATWQNQLILQYLPRCPARWAIDIEVGDLADDLSPASARSQPRATCSRSTCRARSTY